MPTITLLNSTGTRWGTSSYGNSSSPFTLGKTADYTCKGRVGFAPLDPSWYIKSIKLYMNRTDGYAGRTLKLGANADPDYADRGTVDFSLNIYAGSGTGAKSWDLTAYKAILQGYTGTWYLHFDHGSGDSSYCEWTSGTGSSAPRLVVEYEEATLSVPGGAFTIGSPSTITVGTAGSGLTHKVSYSIGASSGALNGGAAVTAGGTISWTPAAALANEIRDGMVGTVRMTLESYLGGVLSSTILLDYPLNVPASYLPVINSASTTFTLQNPAGDTIGVYVQGRSKTVCAINVTTSYGAPIKEYKLTIGGKTYTVPAGATPVNPFSITTDVLTATGALTAVIEVTDTRGRKATLTRASAVTVNSYFAPMVTGLSLARALSDGTLSNEGTYIKFTLTCVFAAIANLNTKAGSIKFKASAGSYSSAISLNAAMAAAGATAYSFTITGVIGSGTIGSGGYVVSVSLADRYTAAPEVLAELPSKKILFDLHSSGEGVAIGKVASTASLFDVGIQSNFDKRVIMRQGFDVHSANGAGGSAGLVKICSLLITQPYADATIEIDIIQRHQKIGARLGICFASASTNDPALYSFSYTGDVVSAFIYKPATSTWDIYVEKTETWDYIGVVGCRLCEFMAARTTITWTNAQVASAPAGATKATYAYGDGDGLSGLGIKFGTVAFAAAASTATVVSVTFATPYSAPPNVVFGLYTGDSWGAASYFLFAHLATVTAVGFTLRIINNYASVRNGSFYWQAIGT